MELKQITETRDTGKWFEIPGKFFEGKNVKLLLKPIIGEDMAKAEAVITKYNKKTHMPYKETDEKKQKKNFEDLLFNSVGGWEGMENEGQPAEFTRENWDLFIENLGALVLFEEYSEEKEREIKVTLSSWLAKTMMNPDKFYKDDIENL